MLSHYYTDPLQPLHTAQSEAENNIHRAVEWSISKAYDELRALGEVEFPNIDVELPPGPNWLAQLVCQGAEKANGYYEKLIAHYDIQRGVVDPPSGLDRVARRLVAELIRYAALSFAAVLGRAIDESNMHPPEVSLAAATLAAVAQVPFKVVARRIADKEERRLVERMYDELLATGTVETHLAEDDRAVRDLHAQEVLARRPPQAQASKVFPFRPREQVVTSVARKRAAGSLDGSNVVALRAAPPQGDDDSANVGGCAGEPPPQSRPHRAARAGDSATAARAQSCGPAVAGGLRSRATISPSTAMWSTAPRSVPRPPSAWRRTASRRIRDLMRAEPAALAVLMDNRHIAPETIADWQDQARLVCTVPGLRGTHAQLLVGAGYRSADAIAAAEADKLCADVLAFAASKDGQRVLRNGDPPDIEKIKGWLEAAHSVKAA